MRAGGDLRIGSVVHVDRLDTVGEVAASIGHRPGARYNDRACTGFRVSVRHRNDAARIIGSAAVRAVGEHGVSRRGRAFVVGRAGNSAGIAAFYVACLRAGRDLRILRVVHVDYLDTVAEVAAGIGHRPGARYHDRACAGFRVFISHRNDAAGVVGRAAVCTIGEHRVRGGGRAFVVGRARDSAGITAFYVARLRAGCDQRIGGVIDVDRLDTVGEVAAGIGHRPGARYNDRAITGFRVFVRHRNDAAGVVGRAGVRAVGEHRVRRGGRAFVVGRAGDSTRVATFNVARLRTGCDLRVGRVVHIDRLDTIREVAAGIGHRPGARYHDRAGAGFRVNIRHRNDAANVIGRARVRAVGEHRVGRVGRAFVVGRAGNSARVAAFNVARLRAGRDLRVLRVVDADGLCALIRSAGQVGHRPNTRYGDGTGAGFGVFVFVRQQGNTAIISCRATGAGELHRRDSDIRFRINQTRDGICTATFQILIHWAGGDFRVNIVFQRNRESFVVHARTESRRHGNRRRSNSGGGIESGDFRVGAGVVAVDETDRSAARPGEQGAVIGRCSK